MDESRRAPPYEDDFSLPEYDYEILYLELAQAVRGKDIDAIRHHVLTSNYLIEMEEMPMYLTIKYCIVVAALLTSEDWVLAQTVQCVGEACWRTMFEYACDHGNPEAYLPLANLRSYLNRLEAMRVKAGVQFYKLDEDHFRFSDDLYDFEEDDPPPDYSIFDEDTPPAYDDLYGSLQRTVRQSRKRKRACTLEAAMPQTKVVVLRYAGPRPIQI